MSIMTVVNMSLIASPMIAAIAAVRFFTLHKLPKRTFNILWTIVLCSLLIPYNLFARFDISVHITALGEKVQEIFVKAPEIIDIVPIAENAVSKADISNIAIADIDDSSNSVFYDIFRFGRDIFGRIEFMNTAGTDVLTGAAETTANQFNLYILLLPLIWLAGVLCFAAYFIVTHIKCRRIYAEALPIDNTFVRAWRVEYSDSMRRKVKIKHSDQIHSPLTYGIFKPVILLPCDTDYSDETSLKYILFHEYTHIWRFDTLSKLFLAAVLCVHWFNPFVWLMYILANRDIELSCDEAVVSESMAADDIKLKYASTLIKLAEKKNMPASGVSFSRNVMKERIISIMKIKKNSKLRIIAAIILISMIIAMFAVLQSCEDITNPEVKIIEITNAQGEIIATQEIFELEPFDMPEKTDKLVLYTFHMNTFTLTPAVNIFKEKYPDVEVEIINLGNDYDTLLKTELAAGKGPDLVLAFDSNFSDIYKMMDTDIFVDLNQFISCDSEFNLDDYVRAVIDGGVYKGKRYIMPVEYSVPLLTTTQEILDEEKITPSDFNTFDGFIRIVEQYNEKYKDNPDKSALIDWKANHMNLEYFLKYSGIDLVNYEKTIIEVDKTNFKKLVDLIQPLYISDEDRKNIDGNALISEITNLKQGSGLSDRHWLFNNSFTTTGTLLFLEYVHLGSNNLTPLMFTYPNITDGLTAEIVQFAAIPKASKNQINAYNLLKIILSEEIQAGGTTSGNYLSLGTPVLKSGVRTAIERNSYGNLDEETINKYTDMLINVDSAKIIPRALENFFIDEIIPYWEGTRSFDDCYAKLVSKLELYISE